jgi:acyl-CoA synthetase (AMP-forming)/AMP-acid ligase II
MRLHQFFEFWAREAPLREFAIDEERTTTYASACAAAGRYANALAAWGCGPGDRVAVLSHNSLEYVLAYLAASKLGMALVPLNPRLVPADWVHILKHARPRVLLCRQSHCGALDPFRDELHGIERFACWDGDGGTGWDDFTARQARQSPQAACQPVAEDADFLIIYTSGTTGRPTGVCLTHSAVTANMTQLHLGLSFLAGQRSLAVVPMSHAGVMPSVLMPILAGGTLYVMPRFEAAAVLRALSEERIALATLVPAMLAACLADPTAGQRSYGGLGKVFYGASSIDEGLLRSAMGAFGAGFVQSYGLTEATQALTLLSESDHRSGVSAQPSLLRSAGRPVAGTELRVIDTNGALAAPGTVGEIVARGPQLMRGYLDDPVKTESALCGGWLRTGDAGLIDDAGYLYVVDRLKDVIVSGGENVYPQKVERVLREHPAVQDVAVVGTPDERWGEAVKAVVVPRPGCGVTAADIAEFCRPRVGGFERPRHVEFRDSLPRNGSGKVLKRALRAPATGAEPVQANDHDGAGRSKKLEDEPQ